jgi:ABC-2 type transport system permease protein
MAMQTKQAASPRSREGSPWTGLWAVVFKEMADHLTSARMRIMEILILLTAVGAVYVAMLDIRQTIGRDPFLFLKLFTTSREPLPAFVGFLVFLVPLVAIALAPPVNVTLGAILLLIGGLLGLLRRRRQIGKLIC